MLQMDINNKKEKREAKFNNLRVKSFLKTRIFRLKAKFSPCKKEQKYLCIYIYIYIYMKKKFLKVKSQVEVLAL